MAKKMIFPKDAAKPVGPYSPALSYGGDLIFVSGQISINPKNGKMAEGIKEQSKQTMENLKRLVIACGATMHDCVKITVYLKDLQDYVTFN